MRHAHADFMHAMMEMVATRKGGSMDNASQQWMRILTHG